ncbi:MAG: hypothetical protein ACAI34_12525 [Verrucomicrobium sp.]
MDTTERFITLAKLLPISVPLFTWVTGLLASVSLFFIAREIFRSRSLPPCGAWPLLRFAIVPFFLLWLGARMMHESHRIAPLWPSIAIGAILLAMLLAGINTIRRASAWRVAFAWAFAFQFWLAMSCGFIAELSVSGDYFRWLR